LPLDVCTDTTSFPQYVPVSLSPDGLWVAYTLQSPYRLAHATIAGDTPQQARPINRWAARSGSRTSRQVSRYGLVVGIVSVRGTTVVARRPPARLLFDETGVARLWVWDVATQAAGPVSDAIVRPYATLEGPRWTPDSRGVVTRILPYGSRIGDARTNPRLAGVSWDSTARAPGSTVIVYQTDSAWLSRPQSIPPTPTSLETNYVADLALIEVSTGAVTTLARGYRPFDYWVSPNGRSWRSRR